MSNSTHSQQNQVSFPKDFIVILVHGWLSDESMMDDLVDTLRGLGMTESYWNAVFPNITITKDDSPTCNKFALIQDAFNQRPNSNVFIKVSFSNNEQGSPLHKGLSSTGMLSQSTSSIANGSGPFRLSMHWVMHVIHLSTGYFSSVTPASWYLLSRVSRPFFVSI